MEELELIKEQVAHYLRGVWKNRWVAILVAWFILVFGVLVVDQMKNRYRAETKVYIDTSSVLKPLLKGLAIQSDYQNTVQLMVRQLLSRPNLERAVRALDLDLEVQNAAEMESLLNSVRHRVEVYAPKRSNVYTISFTDTDRELALNMVKMLLDIFVEDTLGKTVNESDQAIEFLDSQIEKYDNLLREAEERLGDFKRKNIGLMPKDGSTYYNQMQNTARAIEQAELSLSELRQRREKIRTQILDLEQNNVSREVPVKTGLDARIESQEKKIDELLLLYTEQHPDVINAQQVLDSLRVKREQEAKTYATISSIDRNPIYQELRILLSKTEADISSTNARLGSLKLKQAELRGLVDIVPGIEAEMQRLNRDYQIHKNNYNELVIRREQAKISEDVESGTEQVKFRVIEPPYVPIKPNFPNRGFFDLVVLMIALLIGYGVSLVISLFQPVFYSQKDLVTYIGGSILGGIRKYDTPIVLRKRRLNMFLFGCANIFLVFTAGVMMVLHTRGILIFNQLQ